MIDAGYDSGALDNNVPTENIVTVERFNGGTGGQLYNKGIVDFTGIEDFASLIQLSSNGNPATNLDLSKNVNIEILELNGTELTTLDLSANLNLARAIIIDNQIQTLTLGTNTVLSSLSINGPLTSLDVSDNTGLRGLSIRNSQLASIDISNNTGLTRLLLDTTLLTEIDLSANIALVDLTINNSSIADLDVSTNTALDYIECINNQLTDLDVSANTLLEELYFSDNQLTTIDISANTALEYLYGNNNDLTNIDLSSNTLLEELELNNNQLTLLNLKNGNNLSTLSYVSVLNNPNLNCIEVDDEIAANAGTGNYSSWDKDATTSYAETCTDCAINGNVRIASQSELDAFLVQLGACKTINGSLTIRNANDITDLSGLVGVEVINGRLVLGDNELLPNLNGLQNLRTLTDGFAFFRNDVLTDITALSGIVDPITNFSISDNPLLTDISSVLDLTVTELLRVDDQVLVHALVFPNVTTLTGANTFNSSGPGSVIFTDVTTSSISVPNLTLVENFFTLRNVDASTVSFPMLVSTGRSFNLFNVNSTTFNFDAVQSLGSFTIDETQLTDLAPFSTVTSIGRSINIWDNPNLTSLTALSNVTSTTDVFLNVTNNPSLTNLNGLDFITGATEFLVIERNTMLTDIDALQAVTSTRYLRIKDNTILTNVDGLKSLTETTETDMSPFLQSTISGNAITSLNLTNLRTVGNRLNIIETEVSNFCGLYPYVVDGDGQTTLNLTGSTFTIADILDCEDVFSCPFYNLPADNFNIEVINETCSDKNNGRITIAATEALSYIATVAGNHYNFTSTLEVPDLAPDSYTLCIAIDGIADCKQCFDATIAGAEKLAGKTTISSKELFVEIKTGTAPYTIVINGITLGNHTSNSFAVSVEHGDEVEVISSLDCEGKLTTKVDLLDDISLSPNPTQGNVTLNMRNTGIEKIEIAIYNTVGVQVSSEIYDNNYGEVLLRTQELSSGIYFVRIRGLESETLKLIKQ